MLNKLTWYIAYKYLISRHENGLISFIASISILGVALGTMVLIIVLSVLNGFREHIETTLLEDKYHLVILSHSTANLKDDTAKIIAADPNIIEVNPMISENGLLKVKNNSAPVIISSKPDLEIKEHKKLLPYGILVSSNLARNYGLYIDDQVILAAPLLKNSILGPQPRFKKFQIVGIIDTTDKVFSNSDIVMSYNSALKFFDYPNDYISGLYLYSKKPMLAEQTKLMLEENKIFPATVTVKTWQENNQTLFQAIRMERVAITILLLIIIAVACFNILSGLFIQVAEKRKDIAILRTIGMSKQQVSYIFILQAVFIALIGGIAGIFLGVLITIFLDSIIFWLQYLHIIDASNSFFTAIANHTVVIHLNYVEIILVFFVSLGLCLIASIIPALKSSKLNPTEALKYD